MAKTDSTEPRLTLLQLTELYPTPPAHAHEAHVGVGHDNEFTKTGTSIATEKVLTDCRRIYPEAHFAYEALTPEQRESLVGFSPALLSYAVQIAIEHTARLEAFDAADRAKKEQRAKTGADVTVTHRRASLLRTQANNVLTKAATGDAPRLAALEVAFGTAGTPATLAGSLTALSKIADEWLDAPKNSALRTRLELGNVTPAYVKSLARHADALREATDADAARGNATPVTQKELDLNDGLNLFLLGQIIDAFDDAHDLDETIPRLVPIATRRLLRPSTKRAKSEPAPAPAPSPEK